MRQISCTVDVSIKTVTKMLIDAGEACAVYHDETVRDVPARKAQCDEMWSFCYAKEKNVAKAKFAPCWAGDVWTRTAIERDHKMILSWEVGDRSGQTAIEFIDDLRVRLANRVQLTPDGHKAYLEGRRAHIRWRRRLCHAREDLRWGDRIQGPRNEVFAGRMHRDSETRH